MTNITRTIGVTCWYFFADQLLKLALQGLNGAVSLGITLVMLFPIFLPFCVTDGDNLINDCEMVLKLLHSEFQSPLLWRHDNNGCANMNRAAEVTIYGCGGDNVELFYVCDFFTLKSSPGQPV